MYIETLILCMYVYTCVFVQYIGEGSSGTLSRLGCFGSSKQPSASLCTPTNNHIDTCICIDTIAHNPHE